MKARVWGFFGMFLNDCCFRVPQLTREASRPVDLVDRTGPLCTAALVGSHAAARLLQERCFSRSNFWPSIR